MIDSQIIRPMELRQVRRKLNSRLLQYKRELLNKVIKHMVTSMGKQGILPVQVKRR